MTKEQVCKKCKKLIDEDEFIEDTHLLEMLNYWVDIDNMCVNCLFKLERIIESSVANFLREEWKGEN